MTKQEKLIVSAYTGYSMVDFDELHTFIENKLGRPVFTHELASGETWAELRVILKEDFLELCKEER